MVTLAEKETETIEIKYTSYLDIYWLTYTPHLVSFTDHNVH